MSYIKFSVAPESPAETMLTLSITMKVKEWDSFMEQVGANWPSWEIGSEIRKLLHANSKRFESSLGKED